MKKTITLTSSIFLLFSFLSLLSAQTVIGTVVNKKTQEPTANALVVLLNHLPLISAVTNDEGKFILDNVPLGKHRLSVEKEGYLSEIYTFETRQTARIRVELIERTEELNTTVRQRWNTRITTASQNAERLINAPATVHIVTVQDIEEKGYTSLADILEDIPEIEIQEKVDGIYSNLITIRGIEGNERFLVLLDGMRITSMATTRHAIDKNFLIQYAKRVEIVLGPSSALYGADAFTGVINIITKDGNKAQKAEMQLDYGMYNTMESSFFAGFGKKDFSFNINGGMYYSREPNLSNFYPKEYAWYKDQYSVNGNVLANTFTPPDTIQTTIAPFSMPRLSYFFHAKAKIKELEIGLVYNSETHQSSLGAKPQYALPIADAKYNVSLSNAYVKHYWEINRRKKNISLSSNLNWNLYSLNHKSRFINSYSNYNKAYKYGFNNNIKLRENLNIKLNRYHNLLAGVSYQYTYALPKTSDLPNEYNAFQTHASQDIYYIGTDEVAPDGTSYKIHQEFYFSDQHFAGAFVQYQANFKNILLVTVGGRIDYSLFKLRSSTKVNQYFNFNPRLGLVFRPLEALRLKLFYGESTLLPSPEKRFEHYGSFYSVRDASGAFQGFKGDFWHLPNPDLKPEKIRSTEFSSSYINDNFAFNLGGYVNIITDLVAEKYSINGEFVGVPIAVVEQNVNNSSALTYGGTFKIYYQHYFDDQKTIRISAYASYTYSDGAISNPDTNGIMVANPLPFSARHTIKGGVTFKYKKFNIHTRGLYRSATINAKQEGNAPFFLVNAYASYQVYESPLKKMSFDVFVRVRNLTDARYYNTTLVSLIAFSAVPQDPIRLVVGVKAKINK